MCTLPLHARAVADGTHRFVDGLHTAMLVSGTVMLAAAVLAAVLLRTRSSVPAV